MVRRMSTEWRVFRALTIIVKGRVYWEAASFPVAGHLQQAASKELASDSALSLTKASHE
jgi:hypothetical protein